MSDKNMGCCGKTVTETTTKVTAYGNAACDIEPGTLQYIGARYVPIFADPVEWTKTRPYEHLMMVQYQGDTFISKQAVPAGIDLPTTTGQNEYWLLMSNWNAQIEQYREEVLAYAEQVSGFDSRITANTEATEAVALSVEAQKRVERMRDKRGLLFGHRGLHRSAPDNTLVAIEMAGRYGYQGVELDLQKTADDIIVLSHNDEMSIATESQMLISTNVYDALAVVPYTKGSNVTYLETQYLPTLDAALKLGKYHDLFMILEIKDNGAIATKEHVQLITDVVKANQMSDRVIYCSYNRELLLYARELDTEAMCNLVANDYYYEYTTFCVNNDIELLTCAPGVMQQNIVDAIHSRGLLAGTWGGEYAAIQRGVDIIITDDGTQLKRYSDVNTWYKGMRGGQYKLYPFGNEHERECAMNGAFGYFPDVDLAVTENSITFPNYDASPYNNIISTLPKEMPIGTIIEIDASRYQYRVTVWRSNYNNIKTSEWITSGKHKLVVTAADGNSAKNGSSQVVIACAEKGLPNRKSNEFMWEDAARFVNVYTPKHALIPCGVATSIFNRTPAYNYFATELVPWEWTGGAKRLLCVLNDDADIQIVFYHDGVRKFASGWLTSDMIDENSAYPFPQADVQNCNAFALYFKRKDSGAVLPTDIETFISMIPNYQNYDVISEYVAR